MQQNIEHAQKMSAFVMKVDFGLLPQEIAEALRKTTRETVTTFQGSKSRVRVMSSKLLDVETIQKIGDLLESYDEWIDESNKAKLEYLQEYSSMFFKHYEESQKPAIRMTTYLTDDCFEGNITISMDVFCTINFNFSYYLVIDQYF